MIGKDAMALVDMDSASLYVMVEGVAYRVFGVHVDSVNAREGDDGRSVRMTYQSNARAMREQRALLLESATEGYKE